MLRNFLNIAAALVLTLAASTTFAASPSVVELSDLGVISAADDLVVSSDGRVSLAPTSVDAVRNIAGQRADWKLAGNGQPVYSHGHNGMRCVRTPVGYGCTFPGNPEIGMKGQVYYASYAYAPGRNDLGQPYWMEYFPVAIINLLTWHSPAGGGCVTSLQAGGPTTFVGTVAAGSMEGSPGCQFAGQPTWTGGALDLTSGWFCPNSMTVYPMCPGGTTIWEIGQTGPTGTITISDRIFADGFQAATTPPTP